MKTINLVVINLANTSTYSLEGVSEDLIIDEYGDYCEFKVYQLFRRQFNEDFHHSSCSWGVYRNSYTQPYKAPSTILLEKSRVEDNDSKSWSLYFKSKREKKSEDFEELVPKLFIDNKVLFEKRPNSYFFTIGNSKYEYFPKADRLHFQNSNEWTPKGGGLRKLLELFNIQDYE